MSPCMGDKQQETLEHTCSLPSRAFGHARGHFRVLTRFAQRTKKKEKETARY